MIARGEGACLLCGEPLQYYETAQEMECALCHRKFSSHACCEQGHYICDECHARRGVEHILQYCRASRLTDPIRMVQEMMRDPFIYMHGPEHHVMVGAALLTAYHNSGGALELETALEEMCKRGGEYPGGACGFWGCCGAAVSAGMFLSIALGATPLSEQSWGMANEITSRALAEIGKLGGPRCCKRNSFTAIRAAVEYTAEHLKIRMQLPERVTCFYFRENEECLKERCPYHPAKAKPEK